MPLINRVLNIIDLADWNNLVIDTYCRPYNFQQQDGCRDRGMYEFEVPGKDTSLYIGEGMVGIKRWLAADPSAPPPHYGSSIDNLEFYRNLHWHREFYPNLQTIANDLYTRGLLQAGRYGIDVDW